MHYNQARKSMEEEEEGSFDVGGDFHLLTLACFKTLGPYTHSLLVSSGPPNDLSMPRLFSFCPHRYHRVFAHLAGYYSRDNLEWCEEKNEV